MRILHTMLRVGDLKRSTDFYTGVLGFTPCWRSAKDGENCMLQNGRCEPLALDRLSSRR